MNIYLYGNCQTTALMQIMREDYPDWSIAAFDVSKWQRTDEAAIQEHLARTHAADIVIAQPVGAYKGNPRLSSDMLRASMRDGAQLITFPSIVFEGTHGAFTYLPNRLNGFHMDYHNSHTVEMFLRGYHWDDIRLLQASPDLYTPEFIAIGIDASVTELRHREEINATTIRVADFIAEHCRAVVLMNSVNHPNRFFMARTLNLIYGAMALPPVAKEFGPDYLPDPFIPPLPTVLARLGFKDERPHVEVYGRSWTREAYLRESLTYYSRLLRQDLSRAFAGSRGFAFLQSYHRTPGGLFDADLKAGFEREPMEAGALVIAAFGALLKRAPDQDELEKHCAAVHALGLQQWFSILVKADEFANHYSAVGKG